jgi:hypothetical protein
MRTTARVSQSQRSRPGMINLLLLVVTSGAKTPYVGPVYVAAETAANKASSLRCSTALRFECFFDDGLYRSSSTFHFTCN